MTQIGSKLLGFQLWAALPAAEENAPAVSTCLAPSGVPQEGPLRVLLGRHGAATSVIPAPASMNTRAVRLADGERWRHVPPAGHTVAWVAVFDESGSAVDFVAHGETAFVLDSAVKHPHELVMGRWSVHTSAAALAQGEAEIERIGLRLRTEGRLR